mmetsp:Transcript_20832/g.24616  ORF Transcript_20832/g.24616 Transcript_20832/m.24616 type:complete len:179 (+) Transcript_20832:95-631(+)
MFRRIGCFVNLHRNNVARWNSSNPLKNKKGGAMNKEEVDRIAEKAKKEQMLWDALIPEKRVSFTSPIFWVLLGSVVSLHYYNGEQREIENDEKKRDLKLAQLAVERRRVAPLTVEEKAAQISLKERQLILWENKLLLVQEELQGGGIEKKKEAIEIRQAHALERIDNIKASLNELRSS